MTQQPLTPRSLAQRARQISMRLVSQSFRRAFRLVRQLSARYIYPRAPRLHSFLFFEMRRRVIAAVALVPARQVRRLPTALFRSDMSSAPTDYNPKVSIIVPCYNHAAFLEQRLDSIARQTYRNVEVILLDDASTDGSVDLLAAYARQHPEDTRVQFNDENSGSPFSQWAKGIRMATGELLWIAESDDFSDSGFLAEMVPLFANQSVMLAFARTIFVDSSGTQQVWSMPEYLPELPSQTWEQPFTISSQKLVQTIWGRKNVIANVSAAVFRRTPQMELLDDPEWRQMRVCGDWLFYLHIANGGLVAYTPRATNYFRQHAGNSSVALHGQEAYLAEHLSVAEYVMSDYRLDSQAVVALLRELRTRWHQRHVTAIPEHLEQRLGAIEGNPASTFPHRPHVLMVVYSLVPGGGEIMPLNLANLLRRRGNIVSVLSLHQRPSRPEVRAMLRPDVPLFELDALDDLPGIVADLAIDVIHSHHTWVDATIAELKPRLGEVSHVITSHGMYDVIAHDELRLRGKLLATSVMEATYVAEKNRAPLVALGIDADRLTRIPNATEHHEIRAIDTRVLDIPKDAFVVCLVSRASRDKGWQEAIEAVRIAQSQTERPLHLLIGGDGVELHRLRSVVNSASIHFLGFQAEAWNVYAAANLGILPSSYPGESQPLTLIECLAAGKPFLASDIGEIGSMLTTPRGMAGFTVPLLDGAASPDLFAEKILTYLHDPDLYEQHCVIARDAYRSFRPEVMADSYEAVYVKAWGRGGGDRQHP